LKELNGKSIVDAFAVRGCILDKSSFDFKNLDTSSETTFEKDGEFSKINVKGEAGSHRQFTITATQSK